MVFHLPKWYWIYWNFKVQRNYEDNQIQHTCSNFNLLQFPQSLYPNYESLWLFLDCSDMFLSIVSSLGSHRTKLLPLPCDNISSILISLPFYHSTKTQSVSRLKKKKKTQSLLLLHVIFQNLTTNILVAFLRIILPLLTLYTFCPQREKSSVFEYHVYFTGSENITSNMFKFMLTF